MSVLTETAIWLEVWVQDPKTMVQVCTSYGNRVRSMGHVAYMVTMGTQIMLPSDVTTTRSS